MTICPECTAEGLGTCQSPAMCRLTAADDFASARITHPDGSYHYVTMNREMASDAKALYDALNLSAAWHDNPTEAGHD